MLMSNMKKVGDFKNMHMIGKSFPSVQDMWTSYLEKDRYLSQLIKEQDTLIAS